MPITNVILKVCTVSASIQRNFSLLFQVENEVQFYKKRMDVYRSQRDKSRKIVMACMTKLEEKEVAIDKVK